MSCSRVDPVPVATSRSRQAESGRSRTFSGPFFKGAITRRRMAEAKPFEEDLDLQVIGLRRVITQVGVGLTVEALEVVG